MFSHSEIWNGIEAVAIKNGLSLSALAKKAGLDSTSFNKSKRFAAGRERWPSTETVSKVLGVTGETFEDLIKLGRTIH